MFVTLAVCERDRERLERLRALVTDLTIQENLEVQGELVARCIELGTDLENLPMDEYKKVCDVFNDDEMCIRDRTIPKPMQTSVQKRSSKLSLTQRMSTVSELSWIS